MHTKEDLQNLLDAEFKREWNKYELPLYRLTMIDFSKEKAYVLFTASHAYMDGINLGAAFLTKSDGYDPAKLPPFPKIPYVPWIVKKIIQLFYFVKISIFLLTREPAENAMKK